MQLGKNGLTKNISQMVVNDGDEAHGTIRKKITNKKTNPRKENEIIPMHRTHDDGNGKIYLQEWRFIPPSNIAALSLPHDATWRNAAPRPPVKGAAVPSLQDGPKTSYTLGLCFGVSHNPSETQGSTLQGSRQNSNLWRLNPKRVFKQNGPMKTIYWKFGTS